MAGDRDAGVDPRFDPQFQRGYDPSRHRPRSPRAAAPVGPVPAPHQERPDPHPDAVPVEQATSGDDGSIDPGEPEPRRRNPYRLILLLASLAAIAGAGALLWKRIEADPYGGYGGYGGDTGAVFLQQFIDSLMVPLLTGGVLGLCLWFALGALRRRDDD